MGIHERKEREKEHRKEEILDAAQKIFFEKGLYASTMDEIAESAELSKGTLYLYYKSKEDLYLAVMMRGSQLLLELIESATARAESVPKILLLIGEAYFQFFEHHRNYFRMVSFFQTPQFHKQVSEEMKNSCSEFNHRIWGLVIGLVRRGMAEGMLRTDLDPAETAIILWSSSTALMLRIDAESDVWRERMNIDLRRTLRTSNMLLMEAILTDAGRRELSEVRNSSMLSPV